MILCISTSLVVATTNLADICEVSQKGKVGQTVFGPDSDLMPLFDRLKEDQDLAPYVVHVAGFDLEENEKETVCLQRRSIRLTRDITEGETITKNDSSLDCIF